MSWSLGLDLVLAAGLLFVAWRVVFSARLFEAAMLFLVFGLLMALIWVRLQAPSVALAEAAIGAGVTGVLLLAALHHFGVASRGEDAEDQ